MDVKILALCLTLILLSIDPVAAESSSAGRIAFYSDRDGNFEIYSIRSDGTGLKRLTDHEADDRCAAWSFDGSRITFVSKRSGNGDIYVMDSDGEQLRRVTTSADPDRHPAFSPDGSVIAFASERDENSDIYLVDVDGRNERRLTSGPESDGFPQWSPDGSSILFGSVLDGRYVLRTMNPDGTGQRVLLASDQLDLVFGRWSPDGKRIAFFAFDRDTMTASLRLADADGSNEIVLTDGRGRDEDPAWSPDGKEIVFHAYHRDENWDIYIIDLQTREVRRLIDHPAREYWPHWAPSAPESQEAARTPREVVEELYRLVTFTAGRTPDWGRVRSLFHDEAVVVLRTAPGEMTTFSLDGFIDDFVGFIERRDVRETGFTERILGIKVFVYRDIAHVLVHFDSHLNGTRAAPRPGIDSFQLVREDGDWRIISITNDRPESGRSMPEGILD